MSKGLIRGCPKGEEESETLHAKYGEIFHCARDNPPFIKRLVRIIGGFDYALSHLRFFSSG